MEEEAVEITKHENKIINAIICGHRTNEALRRLFKANSPVKVTRLKKLGVIKVIGYEIKAVRTTTVRADFKQEKYGLTGKKYRVKIRKN